MKLIDKLLNRETEEKSYEIDFDKIKTLDDVKIFIKLSYRANPFLVVNPTDKQLDILKECIKQEKN